MTVMIWTMQCAQEPYDSYLDNAVCTGALWQL
jgi:hypothetical protein